MNRNTSDVHDGTLEYMVHVWGGAWNRDANPSIDRDYGIKDGYHYFSTKEDMEEFCKPLDIPAYKNQGIMKDIKYGVMSHKRTVFVATLAYKDKEYVIHYDYGYEYPEDVAVRKWLHGDMSCDCNRSLVIQR